MKVEFISQFYINNVLWLTAVSPSSKLASKLIPCDGEQEIHNHFSHFWERVVDFLIRMQVEG